MNQLISIIIPCYNSGTQIRKTATTILQAIPEQTSAELLLVDDGSSDNTWDEIQALTKDFKEIRGYKLDKNHGEHRALYTGIKEAKGSYIFTMDDDLQHDPADIPALLEELESGVDLVYGQYQKYQHGLFRSLGSQLNGWTASYFFKRPIGLHLSSLRGFVKCLVENLDKNAAKNFYLDSYLVTRAKTISTTPITHRKSQLPASRYTFKKLVKLYSDSIYSSLKNQNARH